MGWKILDKFLVDPADADSVAFDQGGIVRRTTWLKLKNYILGTATLNTTDKTPIGAINEVNLQLSDKANQIAQLSNPNLLINGDFQVWQRGTSFKPIAGGSIFSVDRWNSYMEAANNLNIYRNFNNKLVIQKITSAVASIYQKMERIFPLTTKLTLSAKIDGVIKSISGNLSTTPVWLDFGTVKLNFIGDGSTHNEVSIIPQDTTEHIVDWVKLELGSIATPFVPRLYAEELALCMRYYEVGTIETSLGILATAMTGFKFKVSKRVIPSVTTGNITDMVAFINVIATPSVDSYGVQEFNGTGFYNNRIYRVNSWKADAEIY